MRTKPLRNLRTDSSRRRFAVSGAAAALALPLLVGCGDSGSEGGSVGAESVDVTYAWIPTAAIAPVFVAEEEGIFDDLGINMNFVRFDSGPAQFAALESGDIDIADMGTQGFMAARAQGIDAQTFGIIYDLSGTNQLIAGPDSGITDAESLRGKQVGAVNNTTAYVGLVTYLEQNGMTIDDVDYVQLEAQAILPAFINGNIDAAYAWAPWYNQMLAEGGTALTTNKELGVAGHEIFVGRSDWLVDNPDVAAEILEALQRAHEVMDEKGEDWVVELMAKNQSLEPDVAAAIYAAGVYPTVTEQVDPAYEYSLVPADPAGGLPGAFQNTSDSLHTLGILSEALDTSNSVAPGPATIWEEKYGRDDS